MGRIGILSDVRVVDLSHAVAGPSGSQLLGDLGAEVIKIESPAGDFSRGSTPRLGPDGFFYLAVNRNKKSVVLDLYSESGSNAFHDLVKVSDIVFDNLRPGVLDMYYMASDFQSYFISGEPPRASGSRHPRAPMVGVFQTRNGYLVLGPSWPRIAKAIGREWMITDPRFANVDKRFENKKDLEVSLGGGGRM